MPAQVFLGKSLFGDQALASNQKIQEGLTQSTPIVVRTPEGISLQLATVGEQKELQLSAGPSFLR